MKTQLQYPNGLFITFEHEEQFIRNLLDAIMVSDTSEFVLLNDIAIENANFAKKNKLLERTARDFETLCEKLEKENSELRTELENVKILNNDNLATISALREELKSVYNKPATPTKTEKVEKSKKKKEVVPSEKDNQKWSRKPCANCGHLFQSSGPRSIVCPDCKDARDVYAAGEDFTENPE